MKNLLGGWLFVLIYILINWILLRTYPKHFSKRFFTKQTYKTKIQQYSSKAYSILLNVTMVYTIFVHATFREPYFYIGIITFLISGVLYIISLMNYASTPPDVPATRGIYRATRHPQQILTEIMFIGCGFALSSPVIVVSSIVQLVLLNWSMESQEQYCIERYGKQYQDYMKRTPRYFLIR